MYDSDDELTGVTVKHIAEYRHHLKDKLTPKLMTQSFYKTVDNPYLNSLFDWADIIQNNKFTHSKYLNSLIINYYMYNYCVYTIIKDDLMNLNKLKKLIGFSIKLNKHIKKCNDILVKKHG